MHLGRCIVGVKIFRHQIARRYPFEGGAAFETAQLDRMERDGYEWLYRPFGADPETGRTLGLHGVQWTLPGVYERYTTLERKRRGDPAKRGWFAAYPAVFLRRYLE